VKTVLITGPANPAITLDEAKRHLIVDHENDDLYITSLLAAAVEHLEKITGRKFIEQEWKLLLDEWPGNAEIELPFGGCKSVDSIIYKEQDGTPVTWDVANYVVDTESVPGRVVIGYDKSWPSVALFNVNPIAITFITGYGNTASKVPDSLKHAVKLLVAHWYEQREIIITGSSVAKVPTTVDALIWPFRLFGF